MTDTTEPKSNVRKFPLKGAAAEVPGLTPEFMRNWDALTFTLQTVTNDALVAGLPPVFLLGEYLNADLGEVPQPDGMSTQLRQIWLTAVEGFTEATTTAAAAGMPHSLIRGELIACQADLLDAMLMQGEG